MEKNKQRSFRGFTLGELLIVVVILGIMATLIVPRFAGQSEKAKASEAINMMSVIHRALLAYNDKHYGEASAWPAAIDNNTASMRDILGIGDVGSTQGWIYSTLTDGTVKAYRATDSSSYLTLAPNGTWDGAGDYSRTGKYWPNLP